ncbi:MAG: RluA family pseudouridine synthase [Gemmatimonadetes bacterium]|nr:RluA family pseudouridine synthase [Gemmatimonadota bacterium]
MTEAPGADGPAPGRHEREALDLAGRRLDLAVAAWLGVSRTRAATLVANDRVRVNGRKERAAYPVEAGDRLTADVPAPEGRDVVPEQIPLTILYEDSEVLVVDKPAGMVVHPAPGHWSGTLVNALMGRGGALAPSGDPDRAGLVHRLDKDTSGLLLVARTERAHRVLSAALAARRVERKYAVACWGHLDGERLTVDKPVGRDPRDRQKMAIVANGRTAKTDFRRLARFPSADLLQARLHTGRTHQIRVHLASVGHPVLGDDTYGGGGGRRLAALPPRRHWLHAAWLRFPHPVTGVVVDVRSPLPADLAGSLLALAEGGHSFAAPLTLEYFGFYHDTD